MRLITSNEQAIKRAVIVFLIIGILGRVWTVAVYPPVGGAKLFILSLAATVLLAAACYAADFLNARRISALYERLAPVAPIIGVSCLLTLWAAAVYLFTDTLSLLRLGHFAMGIALIGVVWFAGDSAFRMKLVLGVVVLAAVVSALYGVAVAAAGDPFMTIWIIISKVHLDRIPGIVAGGRIAGLSQNVIAFSYVLAAAAPLAFALLACGKGGRRRERTWLLWPALYFALVLMLTVLLLNATRSAILGAVGGCVVAGAVLLLGRPDLWKRLAATLALVGIWLLLMFLPAISGANSILGREPMGSEEAGAVFGSGTMPVSEAETGGLEDTWFGRALIRVSQPGWPSDENSQYEVELREKIATARGRWQEAGEDFYLSGRIVSVGDTSARARIPMTLTALRYSLEHPLGTGTYAPEPRHLPGGLSPRVADEVLKHTPHNQFLVVLVYYGYPGLLLLGAFYLLIARSLLNTARRFLRSRDTESLLLAAAVTGALAGYGLNSLFHNAGPFVGDWFHFIIVGLVFCIERHAAAKSLPQPHTL